LISVKKASLSLLFSDFVGQLACEWRESRAEFVARMLVLGIIVTMTRAFALTNLFEIVLAGLFFLNSSLRTQLVQVHKDLRVLLVTSFWIWIAVACLWGQAPLEERLVDWWSWRKLLLVPFCFALFRSEHHKRWASYTLIGVCSIYMIASWLGSLGVVTLDRSPSQLLENHATQGVLFSGATLLTYLLAKQSLSLTFRLLAACLIGGFVSNILLILTGRAGYVFLVVVVCCLAFIEVRRFKLLIAGFMGIFFLAMLSLSDVTRNRINEAFTEMRTVDTSEVYTSMGIRLVMWRNTLEMISQKPLLGSGTGSYYYDYGDNIDPSGNWRKIVDANPLYHQKLDDWRDVIVDDPHQQYLHIAAEYGLIGLAIFFSCLCSWMGSIDPKTRWADCAAATILIGTMANGFANGHFSAFVEGRFLWIFLAVLLAGSSDRFSQFFRRQTCKKGAL
jgi:O-antigen ligase